MTLIDSSIEINLPPAEVRAIVLDFERMHEWHTSFLKVLKPLPKGTAPLDMKKGDDMYLKFLQAPKQKVKCYENSPECLAWAGGPAWIFHGIHKLEFVPLDEGRRTLFRNTDLYTGIFGRGAALPGIKGSVTSLYVGYNKDLKKKCEGVQASL